jgi:hypothetical protein
MERELLRSLPQQLRELLEANDPAVGRLFPPAYGEDDPRSAEYDALMRGDLLAERLRALEVMESTLDAPRLDQEQVTAWLSALNDIRLVLGTTLDVTEETYERDVDEMSASDPGAQAHALFLYLGWLEEQVVEALRLEP